jgi:hypothetical protein
MTDTTAQASKPAKQDDRGQIAVHQQMRDGPGFHRVSCLCRIRADMVPGMVLSAKNQKADHHQQVGQMGTRKAGGVPDQHETRASIAQNHQARCRDQQNGDQPLARLAQFGARRRGPDV